MNEMRSRRGSRVGLAVLLLLACGATPILAAGEEAEAAPEAVAKEQGTPYELGRALAVVGLGLAAAIAISVSVIGTGWAVSRVGTAAMGAVAEKPELLGRAIVFVGLAEGIAIYGLIVAIMILGEMPR